MPHASALGHSVPEGSSAKSAHLPPRPSGMSPSRRVLLHWGILSPWGAVQTQLVYLLDPQARPPHNASLCTVGFCPRGE